MAVQVCCTEQPLWLSGGALGPVRTTCWPSGSSAGAAKSGRAFETRCASPVKSDKSCSKESCAVSLTPVSLTPFTPRHHPPAGGTRGCSECALGVRTQWLQSHSELRGPRWPWLLTPPDGEDCQVGTEASRPTQSDAHGHTHTPRGDDGDSGLPRVPSPPCRCWAESLFPAHPCILTLNAQTPPRGAHCPAPGQRSALLPIAWL